MDSLRARLSRRAQQRRIEEAQAEPVDAEAVRRFWLSLATDDRVEALRFEDKVLVQRLHGYMNALCHSDLFRTMNGQEDSGPQRLRGFGFERPAERNCYGRSQAPSAFRATEEFAESDDIFEELAAHLGSPLLDGRPALRQEDWPLVAEAAPDSWHGLQTQALRLVELAIHRSYQDAVAAGIVAAPAAASAAAPAAQEPAAAPSAKAKKRAAKKKKRSAAAQQAAADEELEEEEEDEEAAAAHEPPEHPPDEPHQEEPPGAMRPPSGDVRSGPNTGSVWSAWFPSTNRDGRREWKWSVLQPFWSNDANGQDQTLMAEPVASGIKAFVKHTFVDVETLAEEHEHRPRPKSAIF